MDRPGGYHTEGGKSERKRSYATTYTRKLKYDTNDLFM